MVHIQFEKERLMCVQVWHHTHFCVLTTPILIKNYIAASSDHLFIGRQACLCSTV